MDFKNAFHDQKDSKDAAHICEMLTRVYIG